MKKIATLFIAILCMTLLIGCTGSAPYEMLHNSSEIESIQIVTKVSYNIQQNQWDYEEVCTVEDVQAFAEELLAIDTNRILNDPPQMSETAYVARITYTNGDCELISNRNQRRLYSDGTSRERNYSFDSDSFDALLLKYMEMAE